MVDFDRKAYALEELQRLLATLSPEARVLMDNLPYCAVVGWPFVRGDGSPGMQTRARLWDGAFAIALHHETHEVIVVEQTRESPNGPVTTIEIPGGGIDPGNTPFETAVAELWEEAGAKATYLEAWVKIGPENGFNPIDGLAWTSQYPFLCLSAEIVAAPEAGVRKVTTVPMSRIIKMDNANAFRDPFSPYVIRRAQDWLRENHPELLT